MSSNKKNQQGFTILELLIASTVFSVILLVATAGIIQIGNLYYKGITASKTQETARAIMEEVSRTAQFSKGSVVFGHNFGDDSSVKQICVGDRRYTYEVDKKVTRDGAEVGLRAETKNKDEPCPESTVSGEQLLGEAPAAFRFDRIENRQQEHDGRHRERGIRVGGRHQAPVGVRLAVFVSCRVPQVHDHIVGTRVPSMQSTGSALHVLFARSPPQAARAACRPGRARRSRARGCSRGTRPRTGRPSVP